MIVYAVALTYKDAVPGLQAFSAAQWKALDANPVKWWQERIDGYQEDNPHHPIGLRLTRMQISGSDVTELYPLIQWKR
tara:strand:+ start:76 stop:309 length:234 start_codon:yes stop_codon:yes gene_type:complete